MSVGFIAAQDQYIVVFICSETLCYKHKYHNLFVEISGYRYSDNTAGTSSGSEHSEMLDNVAPELKQTSYKR